MIESVENVENQQSIDFLKQGEIADFQRRKSSSSNFTKTIFARLAKNANFCYSHNPNSIHFPHSLTLKFKKMSNFYGH